MREKVSASSSSQWIKNKCQWPIYIYQNLPRGSEIYPKLTKFHAKRKKNHESNLMCLDFYLTGKSFGMFESIILM